MNIQPLFFTSQFEFQKAYPVKFLKETETKKPTIAVGFLYWLHVVDDVRIRVINNKGYIHIPDLKMIA